MKRLLPILFVCALLYSCKDKNTPDPYNPPPVNPSVTEKLNFEFTKEKPYADLTLSSGIAYPIAIHNLSSGFARFKWDFGDGTYSTDPDDYISVTHPYAKTGTYTIRLTGYRNDGSTKEISKKVYVVKPEIYITGYAIEKIPYVGKYYRVLIHNGSEGYWLGDYSPLLYSNNLPYKYNLNTQLHLSNVDYETIYYTDLYYSNTTAENGTKYASQEIDCSFILCFYPEDYLFYMDESKVRIYFEYRYK